MKWLSFMSLAMAGTIAFGSNAMADAGVKATYNVGAQELWETVDFHQPSENIMPPIASSEREGEGLGAIKVNTLKGGGDIRLQLVYYSPESRAFNYIIQSSPLPVKNYVGEVRVEELGDGRAQLSWRGVFDAEGAEQEKADEMLQGFYESIAARIGKMYPQE